MFARQSLSRAAPALTRAARAYSAKVASAPLDTPLDNLPEWQPQTLDTEVETTTLDNGVTVAALGGSGGVASVGVFAKGGARAPGPAGIAQLLSVSAYTSCEARTGVLQVRELEHTGAQVATHVGREHTAFTANVLEKSAADVLGLFADAMSASLVSPHHIATAYEIATNNAKDQSLLDAAYATGFRHAGPGAPLQIKAVPTTEEVVAARNAHFAPTNLVVAAVGISLDSLVAMLESSFAALSADDFGGVAAATEFAPAAYVGGELAVPSSAPGAGILAFEGPSIKDSAAAALAVATQAAKAAGVEMVYEANSDTGIVGAYFADGDVASAHAVLKELAAGKVADIEAAKKQTANAFAHQTDAQPAKLAQIGVSTLLGGAPAAVSDVAAVTAADVGKVVKAVLASKPTVVSTGASLAGLSDLE